jgi:hypothetical protein
MIGQDTEQLFTEWTRVLKTLSRYQELKGTLIDTQYLPLYITLLDSEMAEIQENMLSVIYEHIATDKLFPFNLLLDSIEKMLENSPIKIKRLCVKTLVPYSSRSQDKIKLLSLIEPLIRLLRNGMGETTLIDDILKILTNLTDQESVRVFIVEEGGIPTLEGLSNYGSVEQQLATKELLRQINFGSSHCTAQETRARVEKRKRMSERERGGIIRKIA